MEVRRAWFRLQAMRLLNANNALEQTYALPTTKKTLGPYTNGQSPVTATFPLWNRREGCGVVCIYLGREERCFIMNDQVPIGATAVFRGQPDMEIIEYKGLEH